MNEFLLSAAVFFAVITNVLVSIAQSRLEKRVKALEESK